MNNRLKLYETPDIEFTRFDICNIMMDDDRNDPTVIFPDDNPESIPDLDIETTDPAGDLFGF